MSERMPFGFIFLQKIVGIIITALGAVLTFYTYDNPNIPVMASFFFSATGLILVVIGMLLLILRIK